jgi:hypothetical protein
MKSARYITHQCSVGALIYAVCEVCLEMKAGVPTRIEIQSTAFNIFFPMVLQPILGLCLPLY